MKFPWISPRGRQVLSLVKVSRIHACFILFSLAIAPFLIGSVLVNKPSVTVFGNSIFFQFNSIPDSFSQFPNNVHKKQATKKNSIAACFVGMTRDFQLTGPTLKKHLLGSFGYSNADVFLISPFDENSHKLSVLEGINLVSFRVFNDFSINEAFILKYEDFLHSGINGQQGLMQQFHMEERCVYDIEMRERKQGWMYEWVVRTRLDGFWTQPPPAPTGLDHTKLYLPAKYADYKGLNDRFSLANRHNTWVSVSRFTMLKNMRLRKGTHAEMLLRMVMRYSQVSVGRLGLHFCIFSQHMNIKMLSIKTASPAGGLYCRPCISNTTSNDTLDSGETFCINEEDWMDEWEKEFDSAVSVEQRRAKTHLNKRTFEECIEDWEQFKNVSMDNASKINPNVGLVWESPSARAMCVRKFLGKKHRVGYYSPKIRNNYFTFYYNINNASEVFLIPITRELAWEWEILETKVRAKRIPFPMQVFNSNETYVSRLEKIDRIKQEGSWKWSQIGLPKIDIILLDVGALVEDIIEAWKWLGKAEPTCQLLINFAYSNSTQTFLKIQRSLFQLGLHLDSCLTLDTEVYGRCTFFSDTYCVV